MAAIRAISLDMGWTLAYPRTSIWEIFAALCTEAGAPTSAEACESFMQGLWAHGQQRAEQLFHSGAVYPDSDEDFTAVFVQMARVVFAQFGVADTDTDLVQRFFQRFWDEHNWALFPDVVEVLTTLRARGFKLGVLSNAPTNLPAFLDRLGITPYLDFTVVSAVEGIKKPDRRIFESTWRRAGVAPHEILHVGDMYVEDILGGRAAGLQTLLIERNPYALFPHHRESESRDIDPQLVVSSLAQILGCVGLDGGR